VGHYERLSALDASFLEIEDVASHMHVAATLLFDAAPLRCAHGGVDMERIRAYIASRLHFIPRYRQRIAYVPLERHPVWIDDDRFNLFYHVRHTALPRPGEERQLKRLCGRIMSQKLDPTKPLWEIWVVEGLEEDRFALIAKAHHAMVDGVSGMDLLTVVLSPTATSDFEPGPPWLPRPAPSPTELIFGEAYRRAGGIGAAASRMACTVRQPWTALREARDALAGIVETLGMSAAAASPTPLNPSIGPHRRFDWARFDLDTVKAVKQRLGGTVNDVVLATVSGAARQFLAARGLPVDRLDFRAMVPVSVRAASEHRTLGNRVANFIAPLPVDEPNPIERYRKVVRATAQQKGSRVIHGTELIEEIGNWTSTTVLTQLMRMATQFRPFNVVVTNVPGPPIPLYLLEAPLRETYPMVPLFANQALGFALFSYAGSLFWGLNADWDAVPDLHDFATALHAELDVLRVAAEHAPAIEASVAS
jgi:WS/DGAT/MGAT family acyltransferase